jgi:hypothetical protein
VKLSRTNMHPSNCRVCGTGVSSQKGYLLRGEDSLDPKHHSLKWITICSGRLCLAKVVGETEVESAERRELRADGSIVMPYDANAVPLLRSIGKWDPNAKTWRANLDFAERTHLLEIAAKLGLTIDPSLVNEVEPDYVRVAVERARLAGGREYQLAGVRRLVSTASGGDRSQFKGMLLADDPGAGKSHQTLFGLRDDEALLVVCPKNAVAVWRREALKWRPDRFDNIHVCSGGGSFRWPVNERELVIVNYEVLPKTNAQIDDAVTKAQAKVDALDDDTDPKKRKRVLSALARAQALAVIEEPPCNVLLVGDEAQYVQNNKAQRTTSWRGLTNVAKVRRVFGLTGTPVESEPLLLWGMLTSLKCNPFTWKSFLDQFSGFDGAWGGIDFERLPPEPGSTARGAVKVKPGTTEILSRVMLRRRKQDVLGELPPKIHSEIPVEIDPKLYAELDEIAAQYIDVILRGELPPFEAMAAVRKALALGTIPALMQEIESYEMAEIPLIVFSAHRAPIEELGKREGWAVITGDTPAEKRGEIQDDFQAGKLRGVAGTIGAMATAMTLTRASTVLFVDRSWRQSDNDQAEDRAHRIGQRDSVNVITFVPEHPLTRHVADILAAKRSFVDATLHGSMAYQVPGATIVDEDVAAWRAKVDAREAAEREAAEARQRREAAARERELAALAKKKVTPEISEQRARARAERLGASVLHRNVPVDIVREAIHYMLSVCDGAEEKDYQGFNKPDAAVAGWLAAGVDAGLEYATASAAAMLRRYPRQLADRWPELFRSTSVDAAKHPELALTLVEMQP